MWCNFMRFKQNFPAFQICSSGNVISTRHYKRLEWAVGDEPFRCFLLVFYFQVDLLNIERYWFVTLSWAATLSRCSRCFPRGRGLILWHANTVIVRSHIVAQRRWWRVDQGSPLHVLRKHHRSLPFQRGRQIRAERVDERNETDQQQNQSQVIQTHSHWVEVSLVRFDHNIGCHAQHAEATKKGGHAKGGRVEGGWMSFVVDTVVGQIHGERWRWLASRMKWFSLDESKFSWLHSC